MSLLSATNFSDAAARAAMAAARMAVRRGTKLWLVHVQSEASARAFGESLRHTAERALRVEADRLSALGAEVNTALLTGPLHEALRTFAERVRSELLVVGEPSAPLSFLGLGGSLDRLLATTPVPLLVVRDAAPFEAWSEGRRPLRVMVGVDRSRPGTTAYEWARQLHAFGPVELIAGHIFFTYDEARRLGFPPPDSFAAASPELRQALEVEVSAQMGTAADGSPIPVRLSPGLGRKADELVALAREAEVDLLVVGSHQRRALGRLWSISHHTLRLAPMSVACVPLKGVTPGAEAALPEVRRVLVATDLSPLGNRAVPYAFSLVQPGGTVHLLHVGESELSADMRRMLERELRLLVPAAAQAEGKRALPEVLESGGEEVATRIAQATERHGVDLICMGSHGRTGLREVVLGSVARAVLGRVRRPVLVVRPPKE